MSRFSLATTTTMSATPALLSLTRLLPLAGMELYQTVQQELITNPALEELDIDEAATCNICGGVRWSGICRQCAGATADAMLADDDAERLLRVSASPSLADTLLIDLYASLAPDDHPIALELMGSLDDRGFLTVDVTDIAAALGVQVARVTAVLQLLRDLGPAGIATPTPRACLLAQIDALATEGISCDHARTIVESYFDDLGAHRYHAIARQLRIPVDAVAQVQDFIRRYLWPYPMAATLSSGAEPDWRAYAMPDLAFRQQDGAWQVELLHTTTGWLRLNPLYQELARRDAALTAAERDHVQAHLAQARTFLHTLRQREQTLQRIGAALAIHQQDFLCHGIQQLKPLTRLQLATELGLHESTVSRAVTGKIARLPDGALCPLNTFFDASRSTQDVLHELIMNESAPLKDHELAWLTEQGYPVAPRTVAKYRERLHIPPHYARLR